MPESTISKPLVIRAWPKMIFLWPAAVLALFMGLANRFFPDWANTWGGTFLLVLGLNLMVLTFEFPRATSLTMVIAILAAIFLVLFLNHSFNVIGPLRNLVAGRQINASTEFYIFFFLLDVVLFSAMFVVTRFDYWELTANELIHHHGLLGDVERFSTAGLKLNKEISDIFEYMLCGAGTIIILLPATPRPIILNNVLNISKIEKLSDRILDARVVRIEGAPAPAAADDATTAYQEAEGG
jgi:hypothetical protein